MPLIAMSNVPVPIHADEDSCVYGPYFLCGWKLNSALPLPELMPWSTFEKEEPAAVPLSLVLGDACSAAALRECRYSLQPDGAFLLQLPTLGMFHVSADARTVTLRPVIGADPQLLRAHFYGSIVAILCFCHKLLPMHGACVKVGDAAVIFTGASGAGKSTLAAACVRAGYPLLCDDVCAIDLSRGNTPYVWPAFPRVKLLPDAIDAFDLEQKTLYTQAVRGWKGHFLIGEQIADVRAASPVSAIYLLHSSAADTIDITPLRGAAAFLPLRTQIHRSNMGAEMGLRGRIFRDLAMLLQAVPVFQLSRPMDFEQIGDTVQAVARNEQALLAEAATR